MKQENCPKCGSSNTMFGAPHSEGDHYNLECLSCGYAVGRQESREE